MSSAPLPAAIQTARILLRCALLGAAPAFALGQAAHPGDTPDRPDFDALKAAGALRSQYLGEPHGAQPQAAPSADLAGFRDTIEPILAGACYRCHGPDRQRGGVQLDDMDPDLFAGEDVDWWLEVLAVVTNDEMPPADESNLSDGDRALVIDWLSGQVQGASSARRADGGHSSFRRLTAYEFDYALRDLLGLPEGYTADLIPDPVSEDGFLNSSEALRISSMQLQAYLDAARSALRSALPGGERPAVLHWGISMEAAAAVEWKRQDAELAKLRQDHQDDPAKLKEKLADWEVRKNRRLGGAYFEQPATGRRSHHSWHYGQARFAWEPDATPPPLPTQPGSVAVLPTGRGIVCELGDQLPDEGVVRVTVEASRPSSDVERTPTLEVHFGWRASNDSRAVFPVSRTDLPVDAPPGTRQTLTWDIPMGPVYPRNSVRGTNKMGDLPSPSEYLKLVNASLSGGAVHIHSVRVAGPVHASWPPASYTQVLGAASPGQPELERARGVLADFLPRAWRRPVSDDEVRRKLALFERLRPELGGFDETMIEVLATALASPKFLYLATGGEQAPETSRLTGPQLAARLAMFLWCSVPDEPLTAAAQAGTLATPEGLRREVQRMLSDPRAQRFSHQFVRQWLDLALLDYLQIDRKAYPGFNDSLKAAMAVEPVAFFAEAVARDHSVLEFLHSEFTMANERLARHYGIAGVKGNHFRRVDLPADRRRGGLLAQAGLLAMNSDGEDSHPLKRGIWMLERLLNDPPPPPPPAVPEIDLTDPEIAKMTLKERIEQHRDHPACLSCHSKIDPWGIAFENFDAAGRWRDEVSGKPVDSLGVLFNGAELDGMDGLKGYLLENRQDQFVGAMVHKLATFALGRPLGFQDRAAIDGIAREVRSRGDGLATMIEQIALSELFQTR